jgi:hypothetical protein
MLDVGAPSAASGLLWGSTKMAVGVYVHVLPPSSEIRRSSTLILRLHTVTTNKYSARRGPHVKRKSMVSVAGGWLVGSLASATTTHFDAHADVSCHDGLLGHDVRWRRVRWWWPCESGWRRGNRDRRGRVPVVGRLVGWLVGFERSEPDSTFVRYLLEYHSYYKHLSLAYEIAPRHRAG